MVRLRMKAMAILIAIGTVQFVDAKGCNMETWPDIDNGVVCGDCYALININSYGTCRAYCDSIGLQCQNAYEESGDSCTIKSDHDCDTDFDWTSDALCKCKNGNDPICHDIYQHSDIGFIMDVSGSVGSNWADEKSFVMDLVRKIDLFPNGAHAAVTTFSTTASLVINFQDHTTTDDFEAALETLPSPGGYTEIGIALDVALNKMFQEANGMRLDSPKVAVLMTDGIATSAVDYAGFREKFRGNHIKLLVVGIGNVNKNDLLQLVETPDDLLLVTDFAALNVTDFVEHTKFCEPDACACQAPLRQKLDELLHGQNQINSELTLLREELEAIRNHVEPEQCIFGVGDGIGGTEITIGKAETKEECLEMVKTQQPSANGVTYGAASGCCPKNCYAEFDATGADTNANWQTCLFVG